MKTPATFYHAGCPVCVEAERQIADALDTDRYEVELVISASKRIYRGC